MAFDYIQARQDAKEIIEEFGADGSFVQPGNNGGLDSSGDPVAAQLDITISGIITPLLQYKTKDIDDTQVLMGDSYVFFHSADPVEVGMITTVNNKTFSVKHVTTLDSVGDINVYRKLQLRK